MQKYQYPIISNLMYVHLFEVVYTLYKVSFFNEAFYQIFHQMPAAIFSTIGIQACFYACNIVNEIVYDVI